MVNYFFYLDRLIEQEYTMHK
jgi:hypothetical protein